MCFYVVYDLFILYFIQKVMGELKFDPKNYRIHTDKNKRLIRKSLEECGAGRSILFDKDNFIIAGNGVYEQALELGLPVRVIESDGNELIAIKRTDLSTEDAKRKALALADNYTSDTSVFDIDAIVEDFGVDELDAWEFDVDEFNVEDVSIDEVRPDKERVGCLKERFIIPPFSILDAKLGYWQERKRAWLDLGIKSDEGREKEITFNKSAQPPRVYEARNIIREKTGIDPSWEELQKYCQDHGIPFMDGTSIFDPVLCELSYRWFNINNGSILDPFAGGSVRGIVASMLDMCYCGIDIRKEQIDANYKNAAEIFGRGGVKRVDNKFVPKWICGDSVNIDRLVSGNKFDLIFSCPPYADLEVYSDDPADLSTMDYPDFIKAYTEIIKKSCSLLNDNRFAVFVVGEVRDKSGVYRSFVPDTITAFQEAGMLYYNEMILVNNIASLAMRAGKQFNNSRKIGKQHQNVLVFYKGDPGKIKETFPVLDFSDDDLFKKE